MNAGSQDSFNPKKRGLGRGLDALFGEDKTEDRHGSLAESVEGSEGGRLANDVISDDLKRRTLPIEWIRPCTFQPRKRFNQEAIDELAESIAVHGVLQPIVVRPMADEENSYEIIAGERRWRASQKAQLHEVPVVIQYLNDEAVLEIALIENLQREDLTPIEEANAFQQLVDNYGHTQEKLAASLGKSRSYIANILRLLTLPDTVQNLVNEGRLSAGHARALIGLENAGDLAKKIVEENLSVREVEAMVRQSKTQATSKTKQKPQKGVNTLALEEEISRILGMRATIDARGGGKGALKIEFKTFEQLDDVVQRLSHKPGRPF